MLSISFATRRPFASRAMAAGGTFSRNNRGSRHGLVASRKNPHERARRQVSRERLGSFPADVDNAMQTTKTTSKITKPSHGLSKAKANLLSLISKASAWSLTCHVLRKQHFFNRKGRKRTFAAFAP